MTKSRTIKPEELQKMVDEAPKQVKALREKGKPLHVDQLFTGAEKEAIKKTGKATTFGADGKTKYEVGALVDEDGYVMALASKVSRTPTGSYDYVKDIGDFSLTEADTRQNKVAVFNRIYKKEGPINNAINISAALIC